MRRRFLFLLFLVLLQRCEAAKKVKKSLKFKKKPVKISPKEQFTGKFKKI